MRTPGSNVAAWSVVATGSIVIAGIINPGLIPIAIKAVTVGAKLIGVGLAVNTAWSWTPSKVKKEDEGQ